MPNLQTNLEYKDPNIVIWRSGRPEDPYKPRMDSLPVINGIITLLEIPSEIHKVRISGFTEVVYETYKKKSDLAPDEFLVDYATGIVQFHPDQEAKTHLCIYQGKGKILTSATRIYTMARNNPDVVKTVQDFVDETKDYLSKLDRKLIDINDALEKSREATDKATIAADNAIVATHNAELATQAAYDAADSAIVIRKDSVDQYDDLNIVYPDPQNGWTVTINTTGDVYRFDGKSGQWEHVGNVFGAAIPFVSEITDGLLKKEDYRKFVVRSIIFQFPKMLAQGVQSALMQFPLDGEIVKAYAFCSEGGSAHPLEVAIEKISSADYDSGGVWQNILSTNIAINPNSTKGTTPVIQTTDVTAGDYFRINALRLDNNIKGVTIQIDVNTKNK
ncbi:hypothetical protein [Cohnella terricola]|uniref:Uncharacterized protein n=1 Tax=Cohnella terricola TaxID=1289167 RepID=A0A559JDM8_9BACL|nr:hypothetical protein [Cohnella terricola]TVX97973.1 hypothetical protein FPZ45_17160 [Cohnella terricola]